MPLDDPFEATHWTLILAARDRDSPLAGEALAGLCQAYWQPIYAYVRRRGNDSESARDLTQAFFAELLRPGALAGVEREKGKFRAFLLASCRHFLSKQREYEQALKRGGGRTVLSIDAADAEGRYLREPVEEATAESLYHRRWALTLLEAVFDDVRARFARQGKAALFDAIKPTLTDPKGTPLAEIATRLGMGEGAVRVAAHRLRRRYREALHARIAATVADPSQIDDEIRELFQAVAS